MIDEYVTEFERCLVGTSAEKAEWTAELRAHLHEAEQAGALSATLESFGSPQEAAAAFRSGRPLRGAPIDRRVMAALLDHVPLGIVTAALAVSSVAEGGHLWLTVPPVFGVVTSDHLMVLRTFVVPLTIIWSVVGLALIEARTGRTPGKALLGLRTVSDDGTPVKRRQAIRRRLSLLGGPLVWLDWAFAVNRFDELIGRLGLRVVPDLHQRLFDLIAHTMVIDDPKHARLPHTAKHRTRV